MILLYKKTILSALVLVVLSMNAITFAECRPCAAAAAARKSKQDAIAAAIAAGKPASREMELDLLDPENMLVIEACCEQCEKTGQHCGGQYSARCVACRNGKSVQEALAAAVALTQIMVQEELDVLDATDTERAPREALSDPCDTCQTCTDEINFCGLAICCPDAIIPASSSN